MSKSSVLINQYDEESIDSAPDGYYVAHVNHDNEYAQRVSKVSKVIILLRLGGEFSEPMSSFKYRGHVYMIEGPIERVKFSSGGENEVCAKGD